MRFAAVAAALLIAAPAFAETDAATEASLKAALAAPERTPANVARDKYRHPLEELKFFGLKNDMAVMEIWPGGGWWTEFLAPVLADKGHYVLALEDSKNGEGNTKGKIEALAKKNPKFAHVTYGVLSPGEKQMTPAPAGSLDLVMTFRNIHNWMLEGQAKTMFDIMYASLKPGGYLGVEEHRGPADKPQDPKANNGYVREDYAIKLIEQSGFKLVSKSEINANPKDTKDYEKGVWTLPPTFLEKDKDRAKYAAIGESDRFTLLFQKPK